MALLNRYPGQAVFLAEQLGNAISDTFCHPLQMQALAAMSANTNPETLYAADTLQMEHGQQLRALWGYVLWVGHVAGV
jgi:hypothetical protein